MLLFILDKKDYLYELNRQLSDTQFYKPIDNAPTSHIQYILNVMLQEAVAMNYIQESTAAFLNNAYPKVPVMYVLPKIHKGGFPPVGRPIIAGCGSVLQPPAQCLEFFLHPFMEKMESYIKDTKHFIQLLEGMSVNEEWLLATFDVAALYTNIPHNEARLVVQMKLESRTLQSPPTHFLLDILDLILEKIYFRVGDQFYYQIKGVTMGCSCAPSIANLFMEHLETEFIYNSDNPFFDQVVMWKRYIDDVFMIFKSTVMFPSFADWLNTIHASIKFVGNSKKGPLIFWTPVYTKICPINWHLGCSARPQIRMLYFITHPIIQGV